MRAQLAPAGSFALFTLGHRIKSFNTYVEGIQVATSGANHDGINHTVDLILSGNTMPRTLKSCCAVDSSAHEALGGRARARGKRATGFGQ